MAPADLPPARAGAGSLLGSDAPPPRDIAGNTIRLGGATAPSDGEDPVTTALRSPTGSGTSPPASPLFTEVRLLTRRGIESASSVNEFLLGATARNRALHPIWCTIRVPKPYIAVNEFEQGTSRRFGRDSFQTRSTS